jgi:hypothetical protein
MESPFFLTSSPLASSHSVMSWLAGPSAQDAKGVLHSQGRVQTQKDLLSVVNVYLCSFLFRTEILGYGYVESG